MNYRCTPDLAAISAAQASKLYGNTHGSRYASLLRIDIRDGIFRFHSTDFILSILRYRRCCALSPADPTTILANAISANGSEQLMPDTRYAPENAFRVVLLLDAHQPGIMLPPEGLLPVDGCGIGFAHVTPSIRGELYKRWIVDVREVFCNGSFGGWIHRITNVSPANDQVCSHGQCLAQDEWTIQEGIPRCT